MLASLEKERGGKHDWSSHPSRKPHVNATPFFSHGAIPHSLGSSSWLFAWWVLFSYAGVSA